MGGGLTGLSEAEQGITANLASHTPRIWLDVPLTLGAIPGLVG